MTVSFTTSKSGRKGERMFAPLGAQSMGSLPDFDKIKEEDLAIGTQYGAKPSVPRTSVDEMGYTYLHGEEGILHELKKKR